MRQKQRAIADKLYSEPFTKQDIASLKETAEHRLAAARSGFALKQQEKKLLLDSIETLLARHPQKHKEFAMMWEKTYRDMRLNLVYCWQSAALDDVEFGKQRAWWWFRTVINAFEYGHEFMDECYQELQKELKDNLSRNEAAVMCDMIDRMMEIFTYTHLEKAEVS